jgi:hypothetical protein
MKSYDLAATAARFAPHSSFKDPTAPADLLPRESIEGIPPRLRRAVGTSCDWPYDADTARSKLSV